jgi:hypothetical protein
VFRKPPTLMSRVLVYGSAPTAEHVPVAHYCEL